MVSYSYTVTAVWHDITTEMIDAGLVCTTTNSLETFAGSHGIIFGGLGVACFQHKCARYSNGQSVAVATK